VQGLEEPGLSKSSDLQKRLLHIRDNIDLDRTFVDGIAYEAFRDNQLVFYAVTRALEMISTAMARPSRRPAAGPGISGEPCLCDHRLGARAIRAL
jgi:hypothetical protein